MNTLTELTWNELDNWWKSLGADERFVMWLRIGQDIGRTRSLEEVSYLYPAPRQLRHVTKQAIHLIEQSALRKLKGE